MARFQVRKIRLLGLLAIATLAMLLASSFPAVPAVPASAKAIRAQPVTTQPLRFPAAFTFAQDGRIFYGEKDTGQIRIIDRRTGSNSLFFTFPSLHRPGLLGITLHPRYPSVPYVYAYGTQLQGGVSWVHLLRITDRNGIGSGPVPLLHARSRDPNPRTARDKGGRLLFGRDGMLYVYVGVSNRLSNAQDRSNVFGKILRMTANGQIPPHNPLPRSLIWSYGHRNSFGMAFDPWSHRLWLTEGGPECNDELNLVVRGGNFGWGPKADCRSTLPPPRNTNQDGPKPILPTVWWRNQPTNTGLVFCAGCGLGSQNEGRLFVGSWGPGDITSMTLSRTRESVISRSVVYRNPSGLVLSMERGPDKALYFSDRLGIYKLVLG